MSRREWNLWTGIAFAAACGNLAVICWIAYCDQNNPITAVKNFVMDILEVMS